MEKGRSEGLEVGLRQKAIEDAKNFKAKGVQIQIIAECTGLSLQEVQAL